MAYREDLDMGKITLISVVSVLLTVALLLFLQVLYYGFLRRQLASAKYSQPDATMTKYMADQQGDLMSIRVVDRDRQVATIPIETSMALVVEQLQSDPSASVTGVPDPEPVAGEAEAAEGDEVAGDEKDSAVSEESPSEEEQGEEGTPNQVPENGPSDNAPTEDDLPELETIDNDSELGDPPPVTGDGSETDAGDESNADP